MDTLGMLRVFTGQLRRQANPPGPGPATRWPWATPGRLDNQLDAAHPALRCGSLSSSALLLPELRAEMGGLSTWLTRVRHGTACRYTGNYSGSINLPLPGTNWIFHDNPGRHQSHLEAMWDPQVMWPSGPPSLLRLCSGGTTLGWITGSGSLPQFCMDYMQVQGTVDY